MKRLRRYSVEILLILLLGAAVGYFAYLGYGLLAPSYALEPFSGERAKFYVDQQAAFGPRAAGTENSLSTGDWLVEELRLLGWDVLIQPFTVNNGVSARNIIAMRGEGPAAGPVAILSTHYDTRLYADKDPDEAGRIEPAPGANAGASGPGVLLELARTLDVPASGHTVCLVLLDAEDNGGLEGWDYAQGSAYFVERLDEDVPRCAAPRVAVYLDMVGGARGRLTAISPETRGLVDAIVETAERIGYTGAFIGPHVRDETDALTRFTAAGVPAVMIGEFDYEYRHTLSDTPDKVTSATLQRVGDVLKAWLERGAQF